MRVAGCCAAHLLVIGVRKIEGQSKALAPDDAYGTGGKSYGCGKTSDDVSFLAAVDADVAAVDVAAVGERSVWKNSTPCDKQFLSCTCADVTSSVHKAMLFNQCVPAGVIKYDLGRS